MNFKHRQIIDVFEDLEVLKLKGIQFSGIENKGEYKEWWANGQLDIHCFYNDKGNLEGEYREWDEYGQLIKYKLYKKY